MATTLAHRAEVQRLARVLGVAPDALAFLDEAPPEALAVLRRAVQDRLFERNRKEFERAVSLADLIPRRLAATLAHRAMGPVLGGRAAGLLRADQAADLAARLPAEFLADVAGHVDLRHVGPLVGGIPTDTMAAAGHVLREREEWIVLSAFAGQVPDEGSARSGSCPARSRATSRTRSAQLLGVFDGEALLRAGFVVEDLTRLDACLAQISDERIASCSTTPTRSRSGRRRSRLPPTSRRAGRSRSPRDRAPACRAP